MIVTNGLAMKRCRLKRLNFQNYNDMSKENKTFDKQQNGNDFIADVSTRFSLTDNQIETIADLFSRRECLVVEGQDTEWLLSHAFQLGMKAYRDLLNGC